MPKLVLDTNVVVSGHINDEGLEAAVLDLVFNRLEVLYISEAILSEYEVVLNRPKFHIASARVKQSLEQIRKVGILVTPNHILAVSHHEPDNRFLECAETARADYLVTGNKRHFPKVWKQTKIVNAREFIENLEI